MNQRRELIFGIVILIGITALMTGYAIHLNQLFYTNYAPFFDSSSYLNQLFEVIQQTKHQGIVHGFQGAIDHSTVALPFLESVLMSLFINQPTRELAPLIQFPWLALFATSIFVYFFNVRRKTFLWSLALTLPFLTISALWRYNGGLSDFRMDLLHYLLIGSTFLWFLSTRYTMAYWNWALTGIFAGLTFLTRGTSPMYTVVCLAPLLAIRIVFTDKIRRWKIILRATFGLLLAVLISGWFYVTNFEYLYYYYVLWNVDANADLPLLESIKHANFALLNIGIYAFSIGMASFCLTALIYWQKKSSLSFKNVLQQVNWEALWLGVAPIAFLVLRGAGHNPFVVMPAAFGILMFMLDPILEKEEFLGKTTQKAAIVVLMLASSLLFLISAFQSIPNHSQPSLFPSMKPQRQLLETVLNDLIQFKTRENILLGVTYISNINDVSLSNILNFNYLASPSGYLIKPASRLNFPYTFNAISSPYNWEVLPGKTDSEKITTLVNKANEELHYVILPEDKSIPYIEPLAPYVIVNRHNGQIKKQLLASGNWKAISEPIQVDNHEVVRLYRNEMKFSN